MAEHDNEVVLKWPLWLVDDEQKIGGGDVLLVAEQNGVVTVWTQEASTGAFKTRTVVIVGTGQPEISMNMKHLGSVVTTGGAFVWHVYEVLR